MVIELSHEEAQDILIVLESLTTNQATVHAGACRCDRCCLVELLETKLKEGLKRDDLPNKG